MVDIRCVNEVLHAVGRRDGINNFSLNAQGCTALKLKDGISIYFEWRETAQKLYLYTSFETGDAPLPITFYQELLRANALTEGPFAALHPQRDEILFQISIPAEQLTLSFIDSALDQLTRYRNAFSVKLQTAD